MTRAAPRHSTFDSRRHQSISTVTTDRTPVATRRMSAMDQHKTLKRRRTLSPSRLIIAESPSKSKRLCLGNSHFLNLPQELVLRILHHLPPPALLNLSLTSHKIHNLANDPQIWKNLFWKRFVGPQLEKKRVPFDISTHALLRERGLWGDDVVLIQEERDAMTRMLPPIPPGKRVPKTFGLDWKAKYKLRHNWKAGSCEVNEIPTAMLPSLEYKKDPSVSRFHAGYLFVASSAHGLRIWAAGKYNGRGPKLMCKLPLEGSTIYPTAMALDDLVCDDLSGRHMQAYGINIVISFVNGTIGIYNFDPITQTATEQFSGRHSSVPIAMLACAQSYVLSMNKSNQLSLYNLRTIPSNLKRYHLTLIHTLQAERSWTPSYLSLRQDLLDKHTIATVIFSFPNIFIQELHIDHTRPIVISSRIAEAVNYWTPVAMNYSLNNSINWETPRPSSTFYQHPHIVTSHPDNTLNLYNVISTTEALQIGPGYTMWGHTASVESVKIHNKRAVSVDRRGEVRVWDLWGRMRGNKSVVVKGTGVVDMKNPLDQMAVRHEVVGFGEEHIVLQRRKKRLESTEVKDFVFDFT